jgi:hypothetical protein
MGEMGFDGGSDEGKGVATMLTTGFDHRQHRLAAVRTRKPMSLILGDDRFDCRQIPNLMSQRIGIAAREFLAATAALGRFERLHLVAL